MELRNDCICGWWIFHHYLGFSDRQIRSWDCLIFLLQDWPVTCIKDLQFSLSCTVSGGVRIGLSYFQKATLIMNWNLARILDLQNPQVLFSCWLLRRMCILKVRLGKIYSFYHKGFTQKKPWPQVVNCARSHEGSFFSDQRQRPSSSLIPFS